LTIEELKQTTLVNQQGKLLRLKDVAEIEDGFVPSISSASINGQIGVYLSIQGQLGSDTYELTKNLEKSIYFFLISELLLFLRLQSPYHFSLLSAL